MPKLIFDLETTGLPDRKGWDVMYDPITETDRYNSARLVQLGYIILDDDGKEIKKYEVIIKPTDYQITNEKFHGISHNQALEIGKDLSEVLTEFNNDLKGCSRLISHNIDFDFPVLLAECVRCKNNQLITDLNSIDRYCTMKEGQNLFSLRKWPKLVNLFSLLYPGRSWEQSHTALDDAECCKLCYLKMTEKPI